MLILARDRSIKPSRSSMAALQAILEGVRVVALQKRFDDAKTTIAGSSIQAGELTSTTLSLRQPYSSRNVSNAATHCAAAGVLS